MNKETIDHIKCKSLPIFSSMISLLLMIKVIISIQVTFFLTSLHATFFFFTFNSLYIRWLISVNLFGSS